MKKFMSTIAFALTIVATSALTSLVVTKSVDHLNYNPQKTEKLSSPVQFTNQASNHPPIPATDFTLAAEKSIEAVVHVKTKINLNNHYPTNIDPFFDFFFGRPSTPREPQYREGSGSGVIISTDGYIVTNNHVIDNASLVEVTLNDKRKFDARVIGTDPSTDIALLKIETDSLPIIPFGNSDNLRIGEWVLAVGNPFNLTSTVTAGIVSAKARNINILNSEMKIESFIQTDAAVNPGNSGGALVNTQGELVGINTAIASQTGSYSGYSFAVPTSIVSKVVADLKEYAVVQRAVLGIQITDITDELAKEKNLKTLKGAYVVDIQENSSAADANLHKGDIITAINNQPINSVAELQEQVSRYRPGNDIKINYIRNNKDESVIVKLKNRSGNTNIVKTTDNSILGATFKPVDKAVANHFRLTSGIQIASITKNGTFDKAGLKKDFIILKVNGQTIYTEKDLTSIVNQTINASDHDRALFITGAYTNGEIAHFAVKLE
jgi:Do/DeqQ family serine protease